MSEVLFGKHVFSVLHYTKTHFVPVDGCLTEMLFPKHKVCFSINKLNAPVTELVYVLVLEAKF